MTNSKEDDEESKKRIRKPLPKSKKLQNTKQMSVVGGVGDPTSQVYCPTPQQPTYTQNTHLPFC